MRRTSVVPIVALACAAVGCGGGSTDSPSVPRTTAAAEAPDPRAELERAARRAVADNLRVSQYAGRHNRVPSWASRSTRGAALDNLRASTAENAKDGIRVTEVDASTTYQAIRFDPSYGSATVHATLRARARVYRRGRRAPRELAYTERARIQLDRVGRSDPPHFVVTRITVLR